MSELQDKINKAIDEALPLEIGNALRKRLEQADRIEANFKALEVKSGMQATEIASLKDLNAAQNRALTGHAALDIREKEIRDRETKMSVTELEIKLKTEERISKTLSDTLNGLVRNVEYRNQVFGSVPVSVPGGPGGYGSVATHTESRTETKEAK